MGKEPVDATKLGQEIADNTINIVIKIAKVLWKLIRTIYAKWKDRG